MFKKRPKKIKKFNLSGDLFRPNYGFFAAELLKKGPLFAVATGTFNTEQITFELKKTYTKKSPARFFGIFLEMTKEVYLKGRKIKPEKFAAEAAVKMIFPG